MLALSSGLAFGGPREDAFKLHNRLTGVPPKKEVLDDMEALIASGRAEEAARIAIQHKNFINVIIKNWAKPWSNREITPRADLNDYVATVMGAVRDDLSFDRILWDDIIYVVRDFTPAYSNTDNEHYRQAEANQVDFHDSLIRLPQSQVTGMPANATSGVITTRGSGEAFYSAGTNRRVNRHLFVNFLCKDYEDLHDTTIPDYRVRRDIERNPGGDSRTYKNQCVGCHNAPDAFAGAYAFYDFQANQLTYTHNSVAGKINNIVNYPSGHMVTDDSWFNLFVMGSNGKKLGFRGPNDGKGVKSLNRMIAGSEAFSQCMAKRVFRLVCKKDAVNTTDLEFVSEQAKAFEKGYNMKDLVVRTSVGCLNYEE